MSYDISATVDPGPGIFETHLDLGNMTSNVAPTWRRSSPNIDGLAGINGRRASDVVGELMWGLRFMFAHRHQLEELNPSNGWGDFRAAFRYYAAVARTARDHPDAIFHVDH